MLNLYGFTYRGFMWPEWHGVMARHTYTPHVVIVPGSRRVLSYLANAVVGGLRYIAQYVVLSVIGLLLA